MCQKRAILFGLILILKRVMNNLVIDLRLYCRPNAMMVCCPMTSKIKGYVFEVVVSVAPPSAVLSDQLKNLDWRAREAVFKGKVSQKVLSDVQAKIKVLLGV